MKIVLTGYRCSGKTSVGRELADRLGLRFIDTDAVVERRANKCVREIFSEDGEAAFRAIEREAVAELGDAADCVIAAGGGAVMNADNVAALRRDAKVLWLETTPAELARRAEADGGRPPLTDLPLREEVEKMSAERRRYYMDCADCIIATDGFTPDEVAGRVVEYLQMLGLAGESDKRVD